jgi:glycosyltransferase involved in cell wall biosynthesis
MVLALLETNARAALRLRRLRVRPYSHVPIVILCCWLAEDLRVADARTRERLYEEYSAADLILCLSRNQIDIFEECGFDKDKIAYIPYGVSPGTAPVASDLTRDIPLLSVGVDRGRDYETLVEAMRGVDTPIELYTQPGRVEKLYPSDSVRIHDPVPYLEYRALLRRSKIVVVPTYELAYPTGQSVALQAAAEGACVIVTRTAAMTEYFEPGVTAVMPPPRDGSGLRSAIATTLRDDAERVRISGAGRQSVRANFTSTRMWADVSRYVLGRW